MPIVWVDLMEHDGGSTIQSTCWLIERSLQAEKVDTAQVDQAGATMTEVVEPIKWVTDIMGEISATSDEDIWRSPGSSGSDSHGPDHAAERGLGGGNGRCRQWTQVTSARFGTNCHGNQAGCFKQSLKWRTKSAFGMDQPRLFPPALLQRS